MFGVWLFVPMTTSLIFLLSLFFGVVQSSAHDSLSIKTKEKDPVNYYSTRVIDLSTGEKVDLDLNDAVTSKSLETITEQPIPTNEEHISYVPCKYGKKPVIGRYEIKENGNIQVFDCSISKVFSPGKYSLETMLINNVMVTALFICIEKKTLNEFYILVSIFLSAMCALATFLCQLFTKKPKSNYSLALICLSLYLFIKMIAMFIIIVWGDERSHTECLIIGFIIQYFSLNCLCWFIVMNLDEEHLFRTTTENYFCKIFKNTKKKFIYYFGIFLVFMDVVLFRIQWAFNMTPIVPSIIKNDFQPHNKDIDVYAFLAYYIPSGTLLVCVVNIKFRKFWRSLDFPYNKSRSMNETRYKDCDYYLTIMILTFILEVVMSNMPNNDSDFSSFHQTLISSEGIMFCTIYMNYTDVQNIIVFLKTKLLTVSNLPMNPPMQTKKMERPSNSKIKT